MQNPSDEILNVNSLLIGYSSGSKMTPILPPITASANKGELVAVMGKNGIGKSTLLRTITGLQKSLKGTVIINNENTSRFSRLKFARNVGYISTEIVKVSHMRVWDLVALGRFPHTNWMGKMDKTADQHIRQSIAKAGLENYSGRYISELSDGERQRAMIARVLAQDTDIMIMDEPLAFLDISGKYGIIKLMRELTAGGKTIIFSTHDFSIAVNIADRIWLINKSGLKQGAPEDLWINNEFESLFDTVHTGFNPEDGSFIFNSEVHGKFYIEGGKNKIRKWTAKALIRAGFEVSGEMTSSYIIIPQRDEGWMLVENNITRNFKTLYDLVRYIGSENR